MSYDTEKARYGRRPVILLEMDLDYCANTYGTAPCTASVPTTGAQKCFNGRVTCQDVPHYIKATKTYYFSNMLLPAPAIHIPSIVSVDIAPATIDPGKSIGQRGVATILLSDEPHNDVGIDKYYRERTYNPLLRGTFWGKMLARNPYYVGRTVRLKTGFITDGVFDVGSFENRTYVIDRIEGPDRSGRVKITAKDVLALVDDTMSQAPAVSPGVLNADITDSDGTFTLAPAGIGATDYPASGTVCIGSECMTFTRVGDVMTVVRATDGTKAAAANLGDTVQLCLRYTDAKITDILYDLIVNYAGVDASFIDLPTWETEADTWLGSSLYSAVIATPQGVNSLLNELCSLGLFFIWWDERVSAIKFRAVRPTRTDDKKIITESASILQQSAGIADDPSKRISQVWVYYGMKDPTGNIPTAQQQALNAIPSNSDTSNFSKISIAADLDAESANEYDQSVILTIFSRWFGSSAASLANRLGKRLLARYRNNPRTLIMRLDAKDSDLWTGDIATVTSKVVQDVTGDSPATDFQVLQVKEAVAGVTFEYTLVDSFFLGRYFYIAPNALAGLTYAAATEDQKARYGFVAGPATELMSDGKEGYKIL